MRKGEMVLRARGIELSCYGSDEFFHRDEVIGDEQETKKRESC